MDFVSDIGNNDRGFESDGDGNQLVHQAAASGDVTCLIRAIKQDPEVIQQKDRDGLTPLAHAVHNKHLNVVKRLIKMGADIDCQDSKGRTYLSIAAYQGWYEGVVYLLRKGAKPTITDKTGRSPLHAATYDPDTRSLSAILKRLTPERINATDNEKMTALHWSAFHDRPDHVRLLLQKGADPRLVDIDQKTALHWAAQNGSHGCCLVLAQHDDGGDLLQISDSTGKSVMHLVAAAGNATAIEDLSAYGSHLLEVEDDDDRTPLHWAAATGHLNCVRVLLKLGVCPSPLDVDGMSPFEYAKQAGHKKCVNLLESAMPQDSNGAINKTVSKTDSKTVASNKSTGNKTTTTPTVNVKRGVVGGQTSRKDTEMKLPSVVVGKYPSPGTNKHNNMIDLNQNSTEMETLNAGIRSVTPDIIIGQRKKHKRSKHSRRKHADSGHSPMISDFLHTQDDPTSKVCTPDIRSPFLSPLSDGLSTLSPGLTPPSSLSWGHNGTPSRKQRELSPLRVRTLSRSPYRHPLPSTVAHLRLDDTRTPTPPPFISLSMRKVLPDITHTPPTPRLKNTSWHSEQREGTPRHRPDVT